MSTEAKRYGTDPDGDPEAPGLTVIQIAEEDIANPYYPTIAARELAQDLILAQARIVELEATQARTDRFVEELLQWQRGCQVQGCAPDSGMHRTFRGGIVPGTYDKPTEYEVRMGLASSHIDNLQEQLTATKATITRVEQAIVTVRQRANDVAAKEADYHYTGGLDWAANTVEAALNKSNEVEPSPENPNYYQPK